MKSANSLPADNTARSGARTLVWNLPTRLFHWALALLVTLTLITGLSDNIDWMFWHQRMGYGILGLLIFRVLLGLWGRDYARFAHLPLHFNSVKRYLRGHHNALGHNPLGSWMVVAMLLALAVQSFSGLLTSDDFLVEGPWVYWAEEEWVSLASRIHDFNWMLIAGLITLHLLALAVYELIKRQRLIRAMVTGYAQTTDREDASIAQPLTLGRLSLLTAIAIGATWALIALPG